jgi:hypothetical protein
LFRTSKAKIINNGSSDEFGICEKPWIHFNHKTELKIQHGGFVYSNITQIDKPIITKYYGDEDANELRVMSICMFKEYKQSDKVELIIHSGGKIRLLNYKYDEFIDKSNSTYIKYVNEAIHLLSDIDVINNIDSYINKSLK